MWKLQKHFNNRQNYLFSRLGIPLVVVIGKKASDPDNIKFELHFIQEDKECDLSLNELITEVSNYSLEKLKED